MTTTPMEKCTGTNRAGNRCGKWPEPGQTVCRMHGGAAPAAKAKAAVRILEATVQNELTKRQWEPITDPLAAFADLVGEVWAFKELCRDKLAELKTWSGEDAKGTENVRALVEVYERALDRAGKQLVDMMRLGLTAESLRQSREAPAREMAARFDRVLGGVLDRLELDDTQRARVPSALRDSIQAEGLTR